MNSNHELAHNRLTVGSNCNRVQQDGSPWVDNNMKKYIDQSPILSKSDFEVIKILKPDNATLELFHKFLKPMNAIILTNSKNSNATSALKD